jgi:hypothetical protein
MQKTPLTPEEAIKEINKKWKIEDSDSYNYHRRIIGYDLSHPMLLNLILIQKEYKYKKSAINYIRKNKLTNWLLQETQYSNYDRKYTILGVY